MPFTTPAKTSRNIFLSILIAVVLAACSSAPVEPGVERAPGIMPEAPAGSESARGDLLFGAYTYGGVWNGLSPVLELEADLGRRLDIVHWFSDWSTVFDAELARPLKEGGRLPLISWESGRIPLADIAAGAHDAYVAEWARAAADYAAPVYVRPFPEMNGDWTPWNGQPAVLVDAWRRIVGIFRAEGASNVQFVWSPNITDEPRTDANRMELYYPGAEYVDVLAVDGYNWGNVRPWSDWTSFRDMLAPGYGRITALGDQPFWVAETASTELGGDKGEWVRAMFRDSADFPQLEAIVWFDEDKETDWRAASSGASLAGFRDGLRQLGAGRLAALP